MSMDEKITRLETERDRLLTEVAGAQNLSGILNFMEVEIQELKRQLAEAQDEVELKTIAAKGMRESMARLSQVNGKLVACLKNYRSEHVFCVADPKERYSILDNDPCTFCINADAALAEAQKENK